MPCTTLSLRTSTAAPARLAYLSPTSTSKPQPVAEGSTAPCPRPGTRSKAGSHNPRPPDHAQRARAPILHICHRWRGGIGHTGCRTGARKVGHVALGSGNTPMDLGDYQTVSDSVSQRTRRKPRRVPVHLLLGTGLSSSQAGSTRGRHSP